MAKNKSTSENAYFRRRSRTQYVSALASIAFVLLFLGIFATLTLFTKTFAKSARNAIAMKVFLHDGIGTAQLNRFTDQIDTARYVTRTDFISKEEAGTLFMERTGDQLLETMDGVNPLLASVNLYLKEAYIDADSLIRIKKELLSKAIVADVYYPIEMIDKIGKNVNSLAIIALLVGLVVVILALYLVMGTIRLAIYAQRLTIRSMQLIGATRYFIRRPYIWRGISQGFLAGILACVLLVILQGFVSLKLSLTDLSSNTFFSTYFVGILLGIVLFGTALGLVGSYMAVNKYLSQNLDELMG